VADETDNAINNFNRRDIPLRWKEYRGSISWYRLKHLALARANNQCEFIENLDEEGLFYKHAYSPKRCKSRRSLEMHHRSYPDDPHDDSIENVVILCRKHHKVVGGYD
jgi:hypothetical protein